MADYFLAKNWEREADTLRFRGVMPAAGGSYASLEEALKAIEGLDDPRGFVIVKVISPRIEVKVTLDEGPDEVTEKGW